MEARELLKKYHSRVTKESFLKSLLLGLIVGFAVLLVTAAIWWWFAGLKGAWLCGIFFLVATAGTTPIFYYALYRPSIKRTAKRVDSFGLEERLLTMTELENDTSFIATKQREDAVNTLKKVNEKLLKLVVSVSVAVSLSIIGVCGLGMTTVAAMSDSGMIKSGQEWLQGIREANADDFKITYVVKGSGSIVGDVEYIEDDVTHKLVEYYQTVKDGHDAAVVMAVPTDEWVFAGWSDEYGNPYRADKKISGDMKLTAIFEEMTALEDITDSDELGAEGESGDSEPGDDKDSGPRDEQDGESDDNEPNGEPGDSDDSSGSGKFEDNNKVFDGNTYYGDSTFDNAFDDIMDNLSNNDNLSEEEKDAIEDYLKTIEK